MPRTAADRRRARLRRRSHIPAIQALEPRTLLALSVGGFETPALAAGTFATPTGGPWTFASGIQPSFAGISTNGSPYTWGHDAAPEGAQVAVLQGRGARISQDVPGWSAGTYRIAFDAMQRGNYSPDPQDFRVLVDGVDVGTFLPNRYVYTEYKTVPFVVAAGSHTISFVGINTHGGDTTAFIDDVRVVLEAAAPTTTSIPISTGLAGATPYTGGFVSIPASVQDDTQLAAYLATNPVVPAPAYDVLFTPAVAGLDGMYPIGNWLDNGPTSTWIAPMSHGQSSPALAPYVDTLAGFTADISSPQGLFYYSTNFDMGGATPIGPVTGSWTSDNPVVALFLNGVPQSWVGATTYDALTPFQLDAADFVSGRNTLTVVVFNENYGVAHGSPTGLRIDAWIPRTPRPTGSLSGASYLDADDDGRRAAGEDGLAGVAITLTGTDGLGAAVVRTTATDRAGYYRFDGLLPGTYAIFEAPPAGYIDAKDTAGTLGGTAGGKRFAGIALPEGGDGRNYNFGHQRPPAFTTAPPLEVPAGRTYAYAAAAADPDGDALEYEKIAGPAGLEIDDETGRVTWTTTLADVGMHEVALSVDDKRGGVVEQRFAIAVVDGLPNRPPVFTSTPVVAAAVGTPYAYDAVAFDPDFDALIYALVAAPAGMAIDELTGRITWTPAAEQLGTHAVVIMADDDHGGIATQQYTVAVAATAGNRRPIIVSTPTTAFEVPTGVASRAYIYDVRAVDPDDDRLTFALLASDMAGARIDPQSGRLSWEATTAGTYHFTVGVEDGRGGSDAQETTLVVTRPALGVVEGRVGAMNLTVGPTDAIFLAGRTDVTIPAIGGSLADFPMRRDELAHPTTGLPYLAEAPPQWVPAAPGEVFAFDAVRDDHGVNFWRAPGDNGSSDDATLEGPDGREMILDAGAAGYSEAGPGWRTAEGGFGGTSRVAIVPGASAEWRLEGLPAGGRYSVAATWAAQAGYADDVSYAIYDGATLVGTAHVDQAANPSGSSVGSPARPFQDLWIDYALGGSGTKFVVGSGVLRVVVSAPGSTAPFAADAIRVGQDTLDTYPAEILPLGGIGGYKGPIGALVGVFLDDSVPSQDSPPATLDFSAGGLGTAFERLAPGLGQVFFIGDGRTGTGAGASQRFVAPPTATRLFVGLADAYAFLGRPGGYVNNVGRFDVTILQGAPALAGWTVYADLDDDGTADVGEPTAITAADGRYTLSGLAAGTYTIREVVQAGWEAFSPASGARVVTLAAGGLASQVDFGNVLEHPEAANRNPYFATVAPATPHARGGDPYRYDARAADPDGDALAYDLAFGPDGMGVDPRDGTVVWEPTADQIGDFDVVLRARDGRGGVASHAFRVAVAAANRAPIFTSTPPASAPADATYYYAAHAADPDAGDVVAYTLVGSPAGVTLNPVTGLLTWDPASVVGAGPHVVITAADGRGGVSTQEFDLAATTPVGGSLHITSDYRATLQVGRTYYYQVATDAPAGVGVTYSFAVAAPNRLITPSGLVIWTPSPAEVAAGNGEFDVLATDSRGYTAAPQYVHVALISTNLNRDPVIAGLAPAAAAADRLYLGRLSGSDADHDPIAWSLADGPDGLIVEEATGRIAWVPTADQVGTRAITVRAVDPQGGFATRTFAIVVSAADLPPRFDPTPPPAAVVGVAYAFQALAVDPEGGPLAYTLVGVVAGVACSPDGLVTWASPSGSVAVTVRATDVANNTADLTVTLYATSAAPNRAPRFTPPWPRTRIALGQTYTYTFQATDPDPGETAGLQFELAPGTPGSRLVNVYTWTPTVANTYDLAFVVTDTHDAKGTLAYQVVVAAATAPTLGPIGSRTVGLHAPLVAQAAATDPDQGDAVTYAMSLVSGPGAGDWLAIDPARGRIAGTPGATVALGAYTYQVVATDGYGLASSAQSFTVTVVADSTAPDVRIELSSGTAYLGDTVAIRVRADDPSGIASVGLTIDGVTVALDAHGTVRLAPDQIRDYAIVATVTDGAGNVGGATATLPVYDPQVTSRPTVSLAHLLDPRDPSPSPLPFNLEDGVTAPMTVVGSVVGASLRSYRLEASPVGREDWVTLAAGSITTPGAVDGTFDPTLLPNGSYRLRLWADNNGGFGAVDERVVEVKGRLKLGNLRMSFADLAIPVAGFPITITRTYDTLNIGRDGADFGPGWTLDEGDFQIRVGVPGSDDFRQGFRVGTRVVITRPGHESEGFTFRPSQQYYFNQPLPYYSPWFEPDLGVTSTLAVDDTTMTKGSDGVFYNFDADSTPYNPADPACNPSLGYTLTALGGTDYVFDAETGALSAIADRRGNTLTFDATGIYSNRGREVTFTRDDRGRIAAITDPMGRSILYDYDEVTRDLVRVTDRAGQANEFAYDPAHPHRLDRVVDATGVTAVTASYDDDGRLAGIADAAGQATAIDYDLEALTMSATAPTIAGQPDAIATVAFDAKGNPTGEVDPLGGATRRTFDSYNRPIAETRVVGLADDASSETDDETTTYTYDPTTGQVATLTNPAGEVTRLYYGAFGQVAAVVDPAGGTTHRSYDPRYGNLLGVADATGGATSFAYTVGGDLQDVIAQIPGTVVGSNIPAGTRVAASYTYYPTGDVKTADDGRGKITYYRKYGSTEAEPEGYDENGNLLNSYWQWDDPSGNGEYTITATANTYDANDRLIASTVTATTYDDNDDVLRVEANTTSTEYDALGRAFQSVDADGHASITIYDALGRAIATIGPDGTTSRTAYDARGRVEYADDATRPGLPGRSTRTFYDDLDRAYRTDRLAEAVVQITSSVRGDIAAPTVGDAGFESPALAASTAQANPTGGPWTFTGDAGIVANGHALAGGLAAPVGSQAAYLRGTASISQPVTVAAEGFYRLRVRAARGGAGGRQDVEVRVDGAVVAILRPDAGYAEAVSELTYLKAGARAITFRGLGTGDGTAVALIDAVALDPMTTPAASAATTGVAVLSTSSTEYDPDTGRVTSTTDLDGHVVDYAYDAAGRQVAVHDQILVGGVPTDRTWTTVYDATGRKFADIDPLDGETRYVYDAAGRVARTVRMGALADPTDDVVVATDYDTTGRKIAVTDPLGRKTEYRHDEHGNLTDVILPAVYDQDGDLQRPRFRYGYDDSGNLASVRDPLSEDHGVFGLSRRTTYDYDAQGRKVRRTLPLGQAETWDYDDRGRLASHVDFNGARTAYIYDDLGRLAREEFYEHTYDTVAEDTVTYRYDLDDPATGGRTDIVVDTRRGAILAAQTTATTYDRDGRVGRVDAPEGTVRYEYDPATGRKTRTYTIDPADSSIRTDIRYTYDATGRLDEVQVFRLDDATVSLATAYTYDILDRPVETELPNGTVETRTYNDFGGLDSVVTAGPGGTIAGFVYTYDRAGRRVAVAETLPTGNRTLAYTYDALGRLTREAMAGGATGSRTIAYTYDTANNRRSKADSGAPEGQQRLGYYYDDDDRLTSVSTLPDEGEEPSSGVPYQATYTYDDAGNTLSVTTTIAGEGTTTETSTWDLAGRLATATVGGVTTAYRYDEAGIRVASATGGAETTYLIDKQQAYAQVLEEYAPGGVLAASYVRGLDLLFQDRAGVRSYYAKDGLGSVRALSHGAGAATDTYIYDAYGIDLTPTSHTTTNDFRFAGEQRDATTGDIYLRSRYYEVSTGRFNSTDRFDGKQGTSVYDSNYYSYSYNNPTNFIDPNGAMALALSIPSLSINISLSQAAALATISLLPVGNQILINNGINGFDYINQLVNEIQKELKEKIGLISNMSTQLIIIQSVYVAYIESISSGHSSKEVKGMKIFPIFRSAWDEIYENTKNFLDEQPVYHVLTYYPTAENKNRAIVKQLWSWRMVPPKTPPKYELDEFPYNSTLEGGLTAEAWPVPAFQNESHGGTLGAFYKNQLKNKKGTKFVVVPIPV